MGACCCTERKGPRRTLSLDTTAPDEKLNTSSLSLPGSTRKIPKSPLKRQLTKARFMVDYTELCNAGRSNPEKSVEDRNLLQGALTRHHLFNEQPEEVLRDLVLAMEKYSLQPENMIYNEGQRPEYFLVLCEGTVTNSTYEETIRSGQEIGERSFVLDSKREETLVAKTEVVLWGLHKTKMIHIIRKATDACLTLVKNTLAQLKPFKRLSDEHLSALAKIAKLRHFAKDAVIVQAGTEMDSWMWVHTGKVMRTSSKSTQKLEGNELLEYKPQPTRFTYTALKPVTLWEIKHKDVEFVMKTTVKRAKQDNAVKAALRSNKHFAFLTDFQMDKLFSSMFLQKQAKGNPIFRLKPSSASIVIVVKGSLMTKSGEKLPKMLGDDPNTWDAPLSCWAELVAAEDPTCVALLPTNVFTRESEGQLTYIDEKWSWLAKLQKMPLLARLSLDKIEAIMKAAKVEEFPRGSLVYKQGKKRTGFYIISSGMADVDISGLLQVRKGPLDYFGERALLSGGRYETTVTAFTTLVCLVIPQKVASKFLNERTQNQMVERINQQETTHVQLDNLRVVRYEKQEDQFKVLAFNTESEALHNLHVVEKGKALALQMKNNEWEIGRKLYHPFISPYFFRFDNVEFFSFVTSQTPGMTLSSLLSVRKGRLREREIRFYVSCLVLVLDYLHEQSIVYRTLTLDTVLIDEEGYPQLSDFSQSKVITDRTSTIVGDPHFASPEMIRRLGYRFEVDYWSLGVLTYKCLFGKFPFGDSVNSPYEVYEEVLKNDLQFPISAEQDTGLYLPLLQSLLAENPALRGNLETLKLQPSLRSVEWRDLLSRKAIGQKPPASKDLSEEVTAALARQETISDMIVKERQLDAEAKQQGKSLARY